MLCGIMKIKKIGGFQEECMKSYRKELWFEVPTRRAFIDGRRRKGVLVKIIGD
jgi:hypothetical protein